MARVSSAAADGTWESRNLNKRICAVRDQIWVSPAQKKRRPRTHQLAAAFFPSRLDDPDSTIQTRLERSLQLGNRRVDVAQRTLAQPLILRSIMPVVHVPTRFFQQFYRRMDR
jgi:hypothetical protein